MNVDESSKIWERMLEFGVKGVAEDGVHVEAIKYLDVRD